MVAGDEIARLAVAWVSSVDGAEFPASTSDNDLMAQRAARLGQWMGRCLELAGSELDGIEAPADELAGRAQGDRQLMEQARRVLLGALAQRPDDSTLVQMYALWRRAFEKGSWGWDAPKGGLTRTLL